MRKFFNKSGACAKKRLIECINIDRRNKKGDMEKAREEIEKILSEYFELDGTVSFEIYTKARNKRYITAGAFIK